MTRQEFLSSTFAAGLGWAVLPAFVSCVATRNVFSPLITGAGDLKMVRGNVSRYTNKGGTVGIYESREGFVIIDSQFTDSIQPLLDAVSSRGKPVLYLCNTHHHGDHTSGNIAFTDPATKIIAHRAVPGLQRKAAEKSNKLADQRYATLLFDQSHVLNFGSEKITGYHFGNGHTFGDAIYHFERDNVVHMGDLMFINMIPVYRTADGADSRNWIKILEKAAAAFDNDTVFIFGHADKPDLTTGTKDNLREMTDFLSASNDFVLKAVKEGKPTEQLLKEHAFVPGYENRRTPERFGAYLDELRKTLANEA